MERSWDDLEFGISDRGLEVNMSFARIQNLKSSPRLVRVYVVGTRSSIEGLNRFLFWVISVVKTLSINQEYVFVFAIVFNCKCFTSNRFVKFNCKR